jgi:hypothetical protein
MEKLDNGQGTPQTRPQGSGAARFAEIPFGAPEVFGLGIERRQSVIET